MYSTVVLKINRKINYENNTQFLMLYERSTTHLTSHVLIFFFAEQEERKCRAASGGGVSVLFTFFGSFFQLLAHIHVVYIGLS